MQISKSRVNWLIAFKKIIVGCMLLVKIKKIRNSRIIGKLLLTEYINKCTVILTVKFRKNVVKLIDLLKTLKFQILFNKLLIKTHKGFQ